VTIENHDIKPCDEYTANTSCNQHVRDQHPLPTLVPRGTPNPSGTNIDFWGLLETTVVREEALVGLLETTLLDGIQAPLTCGGGLALHFA
jgi:hypothetical protein